MNISLPKWLKDPKIHLFDPFNTEKGEFFIKNASKIHLISLSDLRKGESLLALIPPFTPLPLIPLIPPLPLIALIPPLALLTPSHPAQMFLRGSLFHSANPQLQEE